MVVLEVSESGAAWELIAAPEAVAQLRHRAVAFATAMGASPEMTYAVELAVSETVTNAVVHAYVGREPGRVGVRCQRRGRAPGHRGRG